MAPSTRATGVQGGCVQSRGVCKVLEWSSLALLQRGQNDQVPKKREQLWLLPLSPLRQNYHTTVFTKYRQE